MVRGHGVSPGPLRDPVSVDLLERSHLGLRGQRAPEQLPIPGDEVLAEAQRPREEGNRSQAEPAVELEEVGEGPATESAVAVIEHNGALGAVGTV